MLAFEGIQDKLFFIFFMVSLAVKWLLILTLTVDIAKVNKNCTNADGGGILVYLTKNWLKSPLRLIHVRMNELAMFVATVVVKVVVSW